MFRASLYKRACGYDHDGKHYPPDTTAAIFWLKNRRSDEWRDKRELDQTIKGEDPLGAVLDYVAKNGRKIHDKRPPEDSNGGYVQ